MTPIQKAKEIAKSAIEHFVSMYQPTLNHVIEPGIISWLATPQAAAILSGEEDGMPLSRQVLITKQIIVLNMNFGDKNNAAEIDGLDAAIAILKKYEAIPEPPKIN